MRYLLPAMLTFVFLATACEPEAGPGFSAEVCLQLDHHGVTPTSATVYGNASDDFPGYGGDLTERFSAKREMRPNGRVCFPALGVGAHWFAAEGFDESIKDSVRGSKFVEITTRADFYEFDMAVSEQH